MLECFRGESLIVKRSTNVHYAVVYTHSQSTDSSLSKATKIFDQLNTLMCRSVYAGRKQCLWIVIKDYAADEVSRPSQLNVYGRNGRYRGLETSHRADIDQMASRQPIMATAAA